MDEMNEAQVVEAVEKTEEVTDIQPVKKKKNIFSEKNVRKTGGTVTMIALLLLAFQAVDSAIAVFTAGSESVSYLVMFIFYIIGAVFLLLPGIMLSSMVRKGVIRFTRSCVAVILSVLFLLLILVALTLSDGYSQNGATYAMLCMMYLADLYVTACIVLRRTKLSCDKFRTAMTVIGLIATVVLFVVLVISIVKMIIDAASAINAVFLADTLFALISYFSFVMFIFSGMLTLHIKEFRK
ncbi:MAG: hypothetical protein IJ289_01980 [Clostridia bacterium]|nr:hypothetical protein [Clostridia bacterium]